MLLGFESLHQSEGRKPLAVTCAVLEAGKRNDYCGSIYYPYCSFEVKHGGVVYRSARCPVKALERVQLSSSPRWVLGAAEAHYSDTVGVAGSIPAVPTQPLVDKPARRRSSLPGVKLAW
jgi:hypothetical protein